MGRAAAEGGEPREFGSTSGDQDERARRPAAFQFGVGGRGVREAKDRWSRGHDGARPQSLENPVALDPDLRCRVGIVNIVGAGERYRSAGEAVDRLGADVPRRLAEADEVAARRQAFDRLFERVLPTAS